jgi:DNA-binding transcriptional MocR family regulator
MTSIDTLLVAVAQTMGGPRSRAEPLYEQLADALAEGIRSGVLASGERLPPHRELASRLNINITTVTKAMAMLQEAGLVESRPGRGTLVKPLLRQPPAQFQSAPSDAPGRVDLSINRPATDVYSQALAQLLPELSRDPRFLETQDYHPSEGPLWAREAAASWLAHYGVAAPAQRLLITEGAQHGLACTLRAVMERGDTLLADTVTYQGINALCRTLGLNLVGVDGDAEGMLPEALERACVLHMPKALFLVPSIHNPTAITLGLERRQALAEVVERHRLLLIEDDVYRPLLDDSPPSFAQLLPAQTIHITAMSKCIAPGLRMGFVLAPTQWVADIGTTLRIDCWSISPLSALVATRLIESGQAVEMVAAQREELRARQALLRQQFGDLRVQASATAPHVWLHLPEPWRASSFAQTCQEHGIGLLPGVAFTLRQEHPPHAVRINLAAARSREQLTRALEVIARLARQGHLHMHDAV